MLTLVVGKPDKIKRKLREYGRHIYLDKIYLPNVFSKALLKEKLFAFLNIRTGKVHDRLGALETR